jgi:Protein of unknown function (DUF1569)
MAKTIFDPTARAALFARIDRLAPQASARWGSFTAPRMMSHLIDAVRMALGELLIPQRKSFLANRVVRYLVIHVFPFPRGAPTAPALLARAPDNWTSDAAALKAIIERAAAQANGGSWQAHPAFGVLSGADWGVLIHKHVDHHLKQFGV